MGKKKSPEQEKSIENKAQKPAKDTALQANKKAEKKLAESVKGVKEKKWDIGIGTTDAKDPKGILSVSTTGLKFKHKKKNLEFTVGIASASEQQKPGELPKNHTGPGVSLEWKF